MEAIYLEVKVRDALEVGKNKALRKKSLVPCVVYGEGKKTLSLKIERGHLIKFMHAHHGGENMVITLKVSLPSAKSTEEKPVIIKEFQRHPVSGEILHVDFNEVSLTKKIVVKVPIAAKGDPIGVKQDGGTLEQVIWEIEVECLPTQIPEKIQVEVANMKIGDTFHVKELSIPQGVVIKHELDAIVFSLVPPHKDEVVAPDAASQAGATEPEVIKKEKKVVEGAAEEPAKAEVKEKSKEKPKEKLREKL